MISDQSYLVYFQYFSFDFSMKIGGTKGVVPATDVELSDVDLESQKKSLRQKIKIA